MKRYFSLLLLSLVFVGTALGQGLDNIVTEKYYVSNAADAAGSIGTLPSGSATWRIYADLAPGFRLQAVYGVAGHPLILNTTTTFFNNEDRGSFIPAWTKTQAADNTVMLDSYVTLGSVCTPGATSQYGVLKSEDNTTANVVNANGLLANNDPSAGIPLTSRDGFLSGSTPSINLVGITPGDLAALDNISLSGNAFTTTNGSIAALTGATGPTSSNRVLIAQLTSTGIVHYELNLQIINTATGVVSNYVASNPVGSEQTNPTLIGNLGVALASEPSAAPSLTFGTITPSSMVLNFTGGNGAKRMVIARQGSAVNTLPIDGFTYAANSVFGTNPITAGNFVVYNGTGTSFTVSGLNPGQTYHFRVIEYNDGGTAGGENYLTSLVANGSNVTTSTPTVYNWNQSGAGPFDWNTPANWTPARSFAASNDQLIFGTGSAGTTISNVPNQTVGSIQVTGNTNITLLSTGASSLLINGIPTTSDDFLVGAGSTLNLTGTSAVNIRIGTAALGSVSGTVNLATTNRMTSDIGSGLRFRNGSTCTLQSNYSGAPFGSAAAVANSVSFEAGSNYIHNSGDDPFQRSAPSRVVTFASGSNQTWNTSQGFDVNGRTYGNLTLNSVITGNNTTVFTFGRLTVGTTGQITITGSSTSTINSSGGITNNSNTLVSMTAGSGGINFTSGSAVLNGTGTGTFSLLATNGGNTTVANLATITTNKDVLLNSLNLVGNATVRFNAPATWSLNGTILGTGSFASSPSYCVNLSFLPSAQAIGSFRSAALSINNVTINRAGVTSTLTGTLTIWGTLLMTDGTLASNGFLALGSNAARQGVIAGSGAGSVTGNVRVDRFVPGAGGTSSNRMFSCPVTGLTTNSAWGDDFVVHGTFPYTYNPNAPFPLVYPTIWSYDDSNVAPETAYESANTVSINPMDGFYANISTTTGSITLDVTGPVNNGSLSKTLPPTINGIHFVGNPYPSHIRWSQVRNLPGQVGLQSSYYGFSSQNAGFGYWNGTIGTFGLNDTIYLGQGFSVTTNTPAGGNFIMDNTVRYNSNTPTFLRKRTPDAFFKLAVSSVFGNDELAVYSIGGGSDTFNPESDAIKIQRAPEEIIPAVACQFDNMQFAIKELSKLDVGMIIPVTFNNYAGGTYSFRLSETSNLDHLAVVFVDKFTGSRTVLNKEASFTADVPAGAHNSRFYISLEDKDVQDTPVNNGILSAFAGQGLVVIRSAFNETFEGTVELMDLSGRILSTKAMSIATGDNSMAVPELSTGHYLVRINSANATLVEKVFIQ